MTDQLQPGDRAPAFDLASDGEKNLILSDFQGKNVVLYFYPKDDTPGCTNQAKGFSALSDQFAASGTVVIGVSKDSLASHKRFRAKYELTIALGSDPEGATLEAYGAWVEKSMYGRQYMGIERSTFLIDATGVLRKIWRKVKVPGHAEAVLAEIKGL
jgi:thioredoxin-dependent peroxiredoxin